MSVLRNQLNFDQKWLFTADPSNQGKEAQWFSQFPEDAAEASVPSSEALFAAPVEVGWYRLSFSLPKGWNKDNVLLHFDRAGYYTEVWLNGFRLGDHEGGWLPFSFDTAEALQDKNNQLVVRVVYPRTAEGVDGLVPAELPFYGRTSDPAGIFGTVSLHSFSDARIEDVFVQPDIRRKRLVVDVRCAGNGEVGEVELQIVDTDYSIRGEAGKLVLDFPVFETWSPASPKLYRLAVSLFSNGQKTDETTVTFGMRDFTLKDRRFHLNHRPLLIKSRACCLAPFYALPAEERQKAYRSLLRETREADFNMITLSAHPAQDAFLSLADEEGILVSSESSLHPMISSPFLEERGKDALTAMIEGGRNHPSLVIWHVFNEERTEEAVENNAIRALSESLCVFARSLDPSRLIFAGGAHSGDAPRRALLVRPYRSIPEDYNDYFFCPTDPVPENRARYLHQCGESNQLNIISGLGPLPSPDAETKDGLVASNFEERGLQRIFGTPEEFLQRARTSALELCSSQIKAMRANSKIAGYFHAFPFDSLDREETEAWAAVQAPLLPLVTLEKHNLHPRESTGVTVQMINETGMTGSADLSLQVVGPTGQVLWKKKRNIKLPRHGQLIWSGTVEASGALGQHRFVVNLLQGIKSIAKGENVFHVFEHTPASTIEVHLLDPEKEYLDRIAAQARMGTLLAPIHIIPPLSNTIRSYPDNDLIQILAQVEEGALAIIFSPPEDWNDLAKVLKEQITITPLTAARKWAPAFHYVKLHPVFDKLPTRIFMRQAYRNTAPVLSFAERGEEDICGSLSLSESRCSSDTDLQWGTNVLIQRYGAGRIVMTYMPILEHLGKDPVADKLFINLLSHFERRSIPPASPAHPDQRAVEWLHGERRFQLRRWLIMGGIALDNSDGVKSAAPSVEATRNFQIPQEGWYRPEKWKNHFTRADEEYELRLTEALDRGGLFYAHYERCASYAYTEFTCERRLDSFLRIRFNTPVQVWLNQQVVFDHAEPPEGEAQWIDGVAVTLKHGKNTVLVKCMKEQGDARFALDIVSDSHLSTALKWWK